MAERCIKEEKGVVRANGPTPGIVKATQLDILNRSASLPEIQAAHLIARFRLDAARARLTAELAWRQA